MKLCQQVAALLLAAAGCADAVVVKGSHTADHTHSSSAAARRYGPKHCVLIDRSGSGSCVIRTDCHGQSTSSLEFAFDCWSANGDIFRHSYGRGGFAEHEEFDTEVQCAQCHPPSADIAKPPPASAPKVSQTVSFTKTQGQVAQHPLLPMLAPAARASAAIAATEDDKARGAASPRVAGGMGDLASRKRAEDEPKVSRYGPQSCVSTWRNTEGHCMVQTACQDVDISSYEFGLICIDTKGSKTKHIFGRGSFDITETFDTLAECSQCIGLDDQRAVAFRVQQRRWKQSADAGEVAALTEEVQTLTKGMTSMLGAVMKLRQKVKDEVKTTPAPQAATLAAWSGEDGGSVDVSSDDAGPEKVEPAKTAVTKTRLRTAAATQTPPHKDDQVEDTRIRKRRHRRRRVVEDEDEDAEDTREDGVKEVQTKDSLAEDDDEDDEGDSERDEHEGGLVPVPTNGIGEPLTESVGAEDSELAVAEDGMASAGALDDGTSSLEAAW